MPLTVPGLLRVRAGREPQRVAIMDSTGRSLTFAAWHRDAQAIARSLSSRGVRRGARVALLYGDDWCGYAVAFCGVVAAGAAAIPVSASLPAAQVHGVLRRVGASAVLHQGELPPPDGTWWSTPGADLAVAGLSLVDQPVNAPDPDDVAQIVCTSGSTGVPKDVAASHANLCHGQVLNPRPRRYAHSQAMVHAFPIGTNAGQMMLIEVLTAAPTLLCAGRFDADQFCGLIDQHRTGTVFLVPSMAAELLRSGAHRRYDLSCVQLLSSSAAALPPATARGLAEAFPRAVLVNYYTSTEAVPAQISMIVDPDRPEALGRPVSHRDLRITDDQGHELPPGEVGEVWLRSDAPPRSYLGDPSGSAAVFRNGWVRMGDLGRLDSDGYLILVDRESDIIKSGALKVSTLRIEAALLEHPAVAEAAAVGLPHPVMGAVPAAVVRLDCPVDMDEVRDFLSARLSRAELPVRLLVVDQLPRNPTGKPIKPDIRRLLDLPTRKDPSASAPAATVADPFGRSFMSTFAADPGLSGDPAAGPGAATGVPVGAGPAAMADPFSRSHLTALATDPAVTERSHDERE
ncbi:acyl--CoA ligase [Micromonospora sp. NBC_00898]|uniref:class I adenylate-forming enzyme family protein n=1 Tax=Micromonospora sp. NBC_00898 TaxID=2975981 RepID=UPI0038680E97|nr:acyl--CoA ligase [Micromonospora sp. NBC_00898]